VVFVGDEFAVAGGGGLGLIELVFGEGHGNVIGLRGGLG
jgi:hypothetical protein